MWFEVNVKGKWNIESIKSEGDKPPVRNPWKISTIALALVLVGVVSELKKINL